jgi:hypothetical protein
VDLSAGAHGGERITYGGPKPEREREPVGRANVTEVDPFFAREFVKQAVVRALVCGGVGLAFGEWEGLALGLVSVPMSVVERVATRPWGLRNPFGALALGCFVAALSVAFAAIEPPYVEGVRAGHGDLAEGLRAVEATWNALAHPRGKGGSFSAAQSTIWLEAWAAAWGLVVAVKHAIARASVPPTVFRGRPVGWRPPGPMSTGALALVAQTVAFASFDALLGPPGTDFLALLAVPLLACAMVALLLIIDTFSAVVSSWIA